MMITITDVDGITIGSTTYKIANGAKIYFPVKAYPTMNLSSNVETSTYPALPLDTSTKFLDRLGPTKYSSFKRPQISFTFYVPIDKNVDTQNNYFVSTSKYNSNSLIVINYYLLFNMWLINHKYYLRDMADNTSKTNLGLPINILMNRNDIFNNEIFSSNGVPVVINNISPTGDFVNLEINNDNVYAMGFKIVLDIDN